MVRCLRLGKRRLRAQSAKRRLTPIFHQKRNCPKQVACALLGIAGERHPVARGTEFGKVRAHIALHVGTGDGNAQFGGDKFGPGNCPAAGTLAPELELLTD